MILLWDLEVVDHSAFLCGGVRPTLYILALSQVRQEVCLGGNSDGAQSSETAATRAKGLVSRFSSVKSDRSLTLRVVDSSAK